MCGIGGILRVTRAGERHEPIPESWLDALDERIAWRGPDGAGRFRDVVKGPDGSTFDVALVHRRLSIIDHEGGGQPFVVRGCPGCAAARLRDRGARPTQHDDAPWMDVVAVAFNGCIYNHRELRAELEGVGHVFASDHSDTEVIAHAWREWPESTRLDKLDGMYATAVWDAGWMRLTIARDRFGEKPLYYAPLSEQMAVVVGSSVPAVVNVLTLMGRDDVLAIHPEYTCDAIALGWTAATTPHTRIYEHVPHRIEGNSPDDEQRTEVAPVPLVRRARDDLAGLIRNRVNRFTQPDALLTAAAVEPLLERAVVSRLEADVPLGCFLSGGIDSSLIAMYASRHVPGLPTLTVRMPSVAHDESVHARAVAEHLGTEHHEIDCDGSTAADDLAMLIEHLGLPFGDSSILPTYWLCREASSSVKVALSGDGGDEMFMGYRRYRAANWLRHAWLLQLVPARLDRSTPGARSEYVARLADAAWHQGYLDLLAVFATPDRRRLLGQAEGPVLGLDVEFGSGAAREFDVRAYLPCDLLRKVDTASMLCGLEVRCPMLEATLARRALGTPVSRHMRGGRTKSLLRELAALRLPPEVANRPKQGFAIPISEWWRTDFGGLGTLLFELLDRPEPFGAVHEVLPINMGFVRQMIDEHWAAGGLPARYSTGHVRKRDHGQRLFGLVTLALWARSVHRRDAEIAE